MNLTQEVNRIQDIETDESFEGCLQCDGYGNVMDANGNFVGRCQCIREKSIVSKWQAYLDSVSASSTEAAERAGAVDPKKGIIGKVLDGWRRYPKCRAVLMSGPTGTGKTMASHYLAKRIVTAHNLRARFIDCRKLAVTIPRMVEDPGCAEYVNNCERWVLDESCALVIDDIGGEGNRQTAIQRIHDYLNIRFTQCAWTIITTNKTIDDLETIYGRTTLSRCLSGGRWMFSVNAKGPNLRAEERN